MKEDIVLTQLAQGHDSSVLGTYTTASSIVMPVVILAIYLSLCTFFYNQGKVCKGKLYFS